MLAIDSFSLIPVWVWPIVGLLAICGWAASVRYQKGLNKYDGPLLASLTNFWRIWQRLWYNDRTCFPDLVKYGPIIRIGPNTLVFNDPEAIKDIYMTHFSKVSTNTVSCFGVIRLRKLTSKPSPNSTRLPRASVEVLRSQTSSPPRTESTTESCGGQ